jgi:hypothetical protein
MEFVLKSSDGLICQGKIKRKETAGPFVVGCLNVMK